MENGRKKLEIIKRLVEMTKDVNDVSGWVNRIGLIVSQAEFLPLDSINWQASPRSCAGSVVDCAEVRNKLLEFEEMLKRLDERKESS